MSQILSQTLKLFGIIQDQTVETEGNTAETVSEICELFADFFESTYDCSGFQDLGGDFDFGTLPEGIEIGSLRFEVDQVLKALNDIDVSMGVGPDSISPTFLKTCAFELAYPLCCIFNLPLHEEKLPDRWKRSYVVPIFKAGSRGDACNYRCVAILPTIGKLFENIVCDMLANHYRNYITDNQHGFMSGRSTLTNLIEFTQFGLDVMESGAQLDVIYTDFSKAFDRVNHSIFSGISLQRISQIKDLGVTFNVKLSFDTHVECTVAKAYSMLGFMKRISFEFTDPYALKSIYCSIVRSILEYASVVWNPSYAVHAVRIESIQKKIVVVWTSASSLE